MKGLDTELLTFEQAIRADERKLIAERLREGAAMVIKLADEITGEITEEQWLTKICYTAQHHSLLAWAKSLESGRLMEPEDPQAD